MMKPENPQDPHGTAPSIADVIETHIQLAQTDKDTIIVVSVPSTVSMEAMSSAMRSAKQVLTRKFGYEPAIVLIPETHTLNVVSAEGTVFTGEAWDDLAELVNGVGALELPALPDDLTPGVFSEMETLRDEIARLVAAAERVVAHASVGDNGEFRPPPICGAFNDAPDCMWCGKPFPAPGQRRICEALARRHVAERGDNVSLLVRDRRFPVDGAVPVDNDDDPTHEEE